MDPNDVALLVSSPNEGGGLFLYLDSEWIALDRRPVSGVAISEGSVYLGYRHGREPDEHIVAHLRAAQPWQHSSRLLNDVHDIWDAEDGLYIAGTWENTIVRVNRSTSAIEQQWKLSVEPDSWHVNSVAVWNSEPVFSAFGEFTETRGYISRTKNQGFVRRLDGGEALITGLNMPHSLVPVEGGYLILANSGDLELRRYDRHGRLDRKTDLGGWVRGIGVGTDHVYAGLSEIRGVAASTGASIAVLDKADWNVIRTIVCPFREIYDIRCIPKPKAAGLIAMMLRAQTEILQFELDGEAKERTDRSGLSGQVEVLLAHADGLSAQRDSLAVRIEALSKHADGLAAQRDSLALRVKALEASTSWKLTRPARAVARAWNALRAE